MKGNKRKMKTNKIFALLIILAFVVSIVPMTQVRAQTAPTVKTYAVVDAVPNPTGIGQTVLVKFGILQQAGAVEQGWTGITVTVVKPDNTTETLGPFTTDSTGSSGTLYTPNQIGTYKFTTHFPQQTNPISFFNFEGGNMVLAGTILQASTSDTYELIVQNEPRLIRPGAALPTEYWSRPIDAQNREWYSISGNWVGIPDANNNYWVSSAQYNDAAPETAHVLWANPLTTGGLTGGLLGDGQVPAASESGDAYEGKFSNSIILNGILYYQRTDPGTASAIYAVDLHTGIQSLFKNDTLLSFGQIFYFNSYNVDGVYTYLWSVSGSTYTAYDPFTGNQQMQIINVPSGVRAYGPSGEILIYQIDYANKWMALWNSTDCGLQNAVIGTPDYGSWGNTAHGNALGPGLNGSNPRCYSWNVSIPAGLTAGTSFFAPILKVYPDRVMSMDFNSTQVRVWALSTAPGSRGTLLFDKTWQAPAEWLAGTNTLNYVGATSEVKNGVIALWDKELRTHYAFSTETGNYLWATAPEAWQDAYGWGNAEHTWYFAYGNLYSVGIGGILYAYDLATGKTAWTYTMSDPYNEPVTGNDWWGWIDLIAAGKIYVGSLEHSAENPVPRGAPYICINATDGSEIWRVNGMFRETRWGGNGIIGDSIITTMDTYDQRIYAIGKGPTAITVDAPSVGIPSGNTFVIRGTVTDTSPSTQQYSLTSRFPNGVPAVSDASMSAWMLYVYKQFERPNNATGVPVTLEVIDSNGNLRTIGTTTSDAKGFFSFQWTPDISGKYTLIATFSGSKAYYGSSTETSFAVEQPSAPTPAPTTAVLSTTEQYFLPSVAAIIVVIILVGAAIILLQRKKL